jgi:hypothetical protein
MLLKWTRPKLAFRYKSLGYTQGNHSKDVCEIITCLSLIRGGKKMTGGASGLYSHIL